jgi:hypothetical protein
LPDRAIGRLHAGFCADGNLTTSPWTAPQTNAVNAFAVRGVQYISPALGATVVGIGNSIMTSSCTTGQSSGFGIRACAIVSTPHFPVSYFTRAIPGAIREGWRRARRRPRIARSRCPRSHRNRAGDRICGTKNFLSTMQCTGQCLVDQLADGLDDPAPCCLAVVIVTRGELVSAVQHPGGGAPDVDLGDQGSPARDKFAGMMTVRRR